jgi:6-phosphogluconolactonase
MPTSGAPEDAAARYGRELDDFFSSSSAGFDLVLLGMGPDGHTASLFPNHPSSTKATNDAVIAVHDAPKPPPTRLSLSFDQLNNARRVVFLVGGADKASTVKRIVEDGEQLPAARVQPHNGELLWLLDAAAAKDLRL